MKHITQTTVIVIGFLLSACAKPPLTSRQVQYQTHSNQVLAKYAGAVSRGFKQTSNRSSRGVVDYGGYAGNNGYDIDYASFGTPTVDYNSWHQASR